MGRIVITIVISLILLVLVGGGVAYRFFCSGPSLEITGDARKKDFAANFLGEYCDSFSNVTVTDVSSNAVVWDVEINPNVAFCEFSLSPGKNPTFLQGVSRAIVPMNQTSFALKTGTQYKMTVRRQGSTTRCGVTSRTFAF